MEKQNDRAKSQRATPADSNLDVSKGMQYRKKWKVCSLLLTTWVQNIMLLLLRHLLPL